MGKILKGRKSKELPALQMERTPGPRQRARWVGGMPTLGSAAAFCLVGQGGYWAGGSKFLILSQNRKGSLPSRPRIPIRVSVPPAGL